MAQANFAHPSAEQLSRFGLAGVREDSRGETYALCDKYRARGDP
jgi:hypothetical protein